jgi:membrane-associated phospholipid phosphatase
VVAGAITEVPKRLVRRPRPYAYYQEPPEDGALDAEDAHLSFFSGHTAFSFAAAGATCEMARVRGYSGRCGFLDTPFLLAAGTAFLRTAADRHYLSDVAVGGLVGWGIGRFIGRLHRPRVPSSSPTVSPPAADLAAPVTALRLSGTTAVWIGHAPAGGTAAGFNLGW